LQRNACDQKSGFSPGEAAGLSELGKDGGETAALDEKHRFG
jgi:hypothetical protein